MVRNEIEIIPGIGININAIETCMGNTGMHDNRRN